MTKGLFFLADEEVENLELIQNLLATKFKNITTLSLVGDDLENEKELKVSLVEDGEKLTKLKIMRKIEKALEGSDFILVLGDKDRFNISLAKDMKFLILTECSSKLDVNFEKYRFDFLNSKRFAYIFENQITFEESGKSVSFDVLEVKPEIFTKELKSPNLTTPLNFEYNLYKKAGESIKTVVLPESEDERILRASHTLLQSRAVNLILLGDESEVRTKATNLGLNLDLATIINPSSSKFLDEFTQEFYNLRKHKGVTLEQAREMVKDRNYFGTMLVLLGKADAMVSGAVGTTADTIRPALQIIKTKAGVSSVSGAFIMCLENETLLFADCAIMPEPSASDLAGVALSSCETAKNFGIEPKIAMLSYSTGESGTGASVEKMKEATALAKESFKEAGLENVVDGPLQFDAAVDAVVAKKKMPNSSVAGNANVFIFPDLNSGNITYKAVQRLANGIAMGPILQGLKKPINDLSRGALVEDIINTVLISAIQSGE
ncbi:MAG: phosphate acetyltransferase [Campylobacteraceae bacterium]|nr:phosphate acetyltransferase [Campylobacteraceae bacterium]